jgi:hypothetical protein
MCEQASSHRTATLPAPSILAPGFLGDATPSSRGGPPSRLRVVGHFGGACYASVDRPCAGQLASHMASTVRGWGHSIVAPDSLGDATPSSRGGAPSRPRVAALSRWPAPLLCFGRTCLCRPVGLAHGLDRARLRRLSHLAFGSESCPNAGAFQTQVRRTGGVVSVVLAPALALALAARLSHHHVLPARLRTLAAALALTPAARPSDQDVLPARLGTR